MKLTFILMFLTVLQISATVNSQNTVISLAMNTGNFGDVIKAIEEQSEFKVFYKNEQINLNRRVAIASKTAPVSEILGHALKGTDIGYTMIDKVIVLAPVENKTMKQQKITGKVTSSDGSGLPGVNVVEKGTSNGTVTDIDGNYSIALTQPDAVLVFSFVGYLSEEIESAGKNKIDVLLIEDIQRLDEIVVVGYGTVKKSDITGSLSSVSSEELLEQPVQNVNQALQGRAAGVDVFNTGFSPGSAPTIRIRGNRSIKAGNDPLYILDGIPVEGGITEVNPLDIESVEILKDASASAIYGSRAANGVILITTKRGMGRKASITYEHSTTFETPLVTIDLMDGGEWAEMRRTAMRSEGAYVSPYANPVEDEIWFGDEMTADCWESVRQGYTWENGNAVIDPETGHPMYDPSKVRSYDWEKEALRVAKSHIHQLSVSGGTENLGVLLSLGYTDQEGIEYGQEYKRFSPRLNLDYQAMKWFKIGMSSAYSYVLRDPGIGLYGSCAGQIPISLPYDTAGNFLLLPTGDDLIKNPLRDNKYITYEERTHRYLGSYYAEVSIWKFKYRINAGIDYRHFRRGEFIEPESSRQQNVNSARYRQDENYGWTVENLLYFNGEFGNHDIGVTLLQSAGANRKEESELNASNFAYVSQKWYNMESSLNPANSTLSTDYKRRQIQSYMGRINYGLLDRYLFTATLRYDGASVFYRGNRWDYFPSFAFAWKAKNEFFLRNINAITQLKLRFGVGTTGQSGVAEYETDGTLVETLYVFGDNPAKGYAPNLLATREVGWEKTTQYNLGVDFGFVNNRISGSVDLFYANTHDLLMESKLPAVTGYTVSRANVGVVNNRGIEVTLNTVNIHNAGGFHWETDIIFTATKEEIVDIYGDKLDDINLNLFIGHPIGSYYTYKYDGILQDTPEDSMWIAKYNASGGFFEEGDIKVVDIDKNDTINGFDRTVVGSNVPKFTGGITNRISYKGFELSFFVYFRVGQGIYNRARVPQLDGRYMAWDVDYYNPLDPDRRNATHQKPRDGSINLQEALWYKEASFVKVRNITLTYTVPKKILSRITWDYVDNLQVYLQATNPFLFTDYDYMDPEAQGRYVDRGWNRNQVDAVAGISGISTRGFVIGGRIGF
ncbi:MAG: TonB-dependent receptor [Bacteroidales bacterium]|nr:TonB-dependent receptor [Bacteroidales bacterium]